VDFAADHRVLLSAFGDSAIWAVAVIGASAPLRLVDGAYSRFDGKPVVIIRDLEHRLLAPKARDQDISDSPSRRPASGSN
jgi:hypothetical protein